MQQKSNIPSANQPNQTSPSEPPARPSRCRRQRLVQLLHLLLLLLLPRSGGLPIFAAVQGRQRVQHLSHQRINPDVMAPPPVLARC